MGLDELVVTLHDTSRRLIARQGLRDRDTLMAQLVVSAVELMPDADGAGITRVHERAIRSSHATSHTVYELDQLQDRLQEGPCFDAAQGPPSGGAVVARDLAGADATRWPRFAPSAVQAGFRSILSVSLTDASPQRHHAALNLYSSRPDAFGDDAVTTAALFGTQIAGLLHGADVAAHLGAALSSRDVIARAKGILMERFSLTDNEAFEMLVESSQQTNVKLAVVAQWLVEQTEDQAREKGESHSGGNTDRT